MVQRVTIFTVYIMVGFTRHWPDYLAAVKLRFPNRRPMFTLHVGSPVLGRYGLTVVCEDITYTQMFIYGIEEGLTYRLTTWA